MGKCGPGGKNSPWQYSFSGTSMNKKQLTEKTSQSGSRVGASQSQETVSKGTGE